MRRFSNYVVCYVAISVLLILSQLGCGGVDCGEGTVEQDGECVQESEALQCQPGEVVDNGACVGADTLCDDGTTYQDGRCVADEAVVCGPNTIEEDGECVADGALACGANTAEENGECVAEEAAECGDGTELDPNTNTCHLTDEVCAFGTAYSADADACIPTEEACDEGTYFADETGLCMPEASCRPGDVVLDGYCVSPVEELAADAEFVADGNTDPAFDGEPVELDVADQGEWSVFAGTIDGPSDLNDDGSLDQHVDYFSFDAEAGDWFEISVRSAGIPNPRFIVYSPDDGNDFYRESSTGTTRDKVRQIVVPHDGTYYIAVYPEQMGNSAVGGEDWDYVGTLEHLEASEATAHDFEEATLSGTMGRLDENFYAMSVFGDANRAIINWDRTPADADQIVQFWSSDGEFLGEGAGSMVVTEIPDDGEVFFVADWERLFGTDLDFELSMQELVVFEEDDEFEQVVSAQVGDVLEIRQLNDDAAVVEIAVADEEDNLIVEATQLGVGDNELVRYVGLQEGDYTVTITNISGSDVEGFAPGITSIAPQQIDDLSVPYAGMANEGLGMPQDYYLVEVDETKYYRLTLTNTGGEGWLHAMVYGLGNDLLVESQPANPSDSVRNVVVELQEDSVYVIRIGGNYTTYSEWADYELEFTALDVFLPGDDIEVMVTAEKGDVLEFEQQNFLNEPVELTVLFEDDQEVFDEDLLSGDRGSYYVEQTGEYTVRFTNGTEDEMIGFDYEVRHITPIVVTDFDAESGDRVRVTWEADEFVQFVAIVSDQEGDLVYRETFFVEGSDTIFVEESGNFSVAYYRSGVENDDQELAGMEVTVEFYDIDEVATFSAEAGDVVQIYVENPDPAIDLLLTGPDGALLMEQTLGESAESYEYVGFPDDGEYTISLGSLDGDHDSVEIDYDIISPVMRLAMTADAGDFVRLTQDNDESLGVNLVVYDDDDQVVTWDFVATTEHSTAFFEEAGNYTVSYFRFGVPDDEQVIGGLEVFVEFASAQTLADFEVDVGDVVEITQSNDAGDELAVEILDDDTGQVVASHLLGVSVTEIFRYVGFSEAGQYRLEGMVFDVDDVQLEYEVISPTAVEDLDEIQEGVAFDEISAPQSYYLVQPSETMTYDITMSVVGEGEVGQTGYAKMFLYEPDDQLSHSMDSHIVAGSHTFHGVEFMADVPYVVRIGGDEDFGGNSWDFEYELSFSEVN